MTYLQFEWLSNQMTINTQEINVGDFVLVNNESDYNLMCRKYMNDND